MPAVTIRCASCGQTTQAPEQVVGQKVKCPSCPAIFIGGTTTVVAHVPVRAVKAEPSLAPDRERRHPRGRRKITREDALDLLNWPGNGLVIVGALGIIFSVGWTVLRIIGRASPYLTSSHNAPHGSIVGFIVSLVFGLVITAVWGYVVMKAGSEIRDVGNYRFAFAGAIVAMVPGNLFFVLGLPLSIWALIYLLRPGMSQVFSRSSVE
jgi:hypothetical protein